MGETDKDPGSIFFLIANFFYGIPLMKKRFKLCALRDSQLFKEKDGKSTISTSSTTSTL